MLIPDEHRRLARFDAIRRISAFAADQLRDDIRQRHPGRVAARGQRLERDVLHEAAMPAIHLQGIEALGRQRGKAALHVAGRVQLALVIGKDAQTLDRGF